MPPRVPAKLSPPRLFDTTPRERLFETLDRLAGHPAVWIEGPAGAGKTALVASYLEARSLHAQWFQVEGDDADPASFFFYLKSLPGVRREEVPTYATEFADDLPRFARRFFRALYQEIGDAVLVFDNVHEALESQGFRDSLREAIAQVPQGVRLIFTSRSEPPGVLARFVAQGAVATLGWDDLRLRADEIAAIAGLESGEDDESIASLEAATGGWAAGVTLFLARPVGLPSRDFGGAFSRQRIYEFLATEILDAADAAIRALLLSIWPLLRITPAQAEALAGQPGADRILAAMYQQNLFLERLPGSEAAYRFHSLFRDFLAAQAQATLGAAACAALEERAAALLEAEGELTEAFARYRAAGQFAACSRMIRAYGERLAGMGRLSTLRDWLAALPEGFLEDRPWIEYWRGVCEIGRAPVAAREAFVRAADGYDALGQTGEAIRAVTGVIDTVYGEWSDFSPLDPWIGRLLDLLDRGAEFPTAAIDLRAAAAAMVALLYRQPRHPRLEEFAERTRSLLTAAVVPSERLAAGTYLLNAYNWMGRSAAAKEIITLIGPLADQPGIPELRRAWWWVRLAYHHYIAGEPRATLAALEKARACAEEQGFAVIANLVELYGAFHHLSEGEWSDADRAVAAYESRLAPFRYLDCAIASYQRAWLAMATGNLEHARELAGRAVELADRAGVPNVQAYFRLLDALIRDRQGEAGAGEGVGRARSLTDGERFPLFAFTAEIVAAQIALDRRDEACLTAHLKDAFALGARHDYGNSLLWHAESMAQLCAAGLERGLEPEYLKRLITLRRLAPPGPQACAWPWPVRVRTLGPFGVERAGEALRFSRKAQKKPLAVLMALIALGGREVAAARLAELVWPDADGDAARAALNTALYRLRHLLEVEDLIVLSDGKLSLDPRRVWVDRWAFEALDGAGAVAAGRRAFDLYRGHFLDREDEAPWMIAPRNVLQARFVRLVEGLGVALESEGRSEEAIEVYERGIALDMLAEPLYRRLMACQAGRGQASLALEAYRRCRQSLSVVLGIAPSPATEALRKTLGQ